MTERTTDTDGAPTTELVDGGKRESAAGGASRGGQRLRLRLPPLGVREWVARRVVSPAQIGIMNFFLFLRGIGIRRLDKWGRWGYGVRRGKIPGFERRGKRCAVKKINL